MFGPRLTTVFRSRWRALWWAASVLIGAYYSIPRGQADDHSEKDDAAAVASLMNHGRAAPAHEHANPWAKDAK